MPETKTGVLNGEELWQIARELSDCMCDGVREPCVSCDNNHSKLCEVIDRILEFAAQRAEVEAECEDSPLAQELRSYKEA